MTKWIYLGQTSPNIPLYCQAFFFWNANFVQEVSDERLRKINEVLQGIKLLKLYGWECLYGQKITKTRQKELKYLDNDSLYWAVMSKWIRCALIIFIFTINIMVTYINFWNIWYLMLKNLFELNMLNYLCEFWTHFLNYYISFQILFYLWN